MRFVWLVALMIVGTAMPAYAGKLSANIRVNSKQLGYDVQYWAYFPSGLRNSDTLPVLYLVDGTLYLEYGKLHGLIDEEIAAGRIKPIVAIFVDPRDPDNWKVNRRRREFVCNQEYVDFFREELIPDVEKRFPVSHQREDRVIAGLSLGGLNAGCFGVMAADIFGGIAMQSPVYYPFSNLKERYEEAPWQPVKIFLSVGQFSDDLGAALRLKKVITDKGYDITFIRVTSDHSWKNWGPLQDDILHTFFASGR